MITKELRNKSIQELKEQVKDLNVQLKDLGIKLLQNNEKNVKKVGFLKRDIARVLTIINEKEILLKGQNI